MTVRLEELLAAATPPYRIAGIPPGIISANDYDVTEEALEALDHFPDAVRLLIEWAGDDPERLARLDTLGDTA